MQLLVCQVVKVRLLSFMACIPTVQSFDDGLLVINPTNIPIILPTPVTKQRNRFVSFGFAFSTRSAHCIVLWFPFPRLKGIKTIALTHPLSVILSSTLSFSFTFPSFYPPPPLFLFVIFAFFFNLLFHFQNSAILGLQIIIFFVVTVL